MRIPDGWLDNLAFFGGKDKGGIHYRATAFLIASPTLETDVGGMALITARHNVLEAQRQYGNTWVRVNTKDGGALDIEVTEEWQFPDDPACDIAAIPFWPPEGSDLFPIPTEWFATEEIVKEKGIGIGDDAFVVGLFSQRVGRDRNEPIMRSGNLAAMPGEPFHDSRSGGSYHAYLMEVRSIGGLSGSPVVVALNRYTRLDVFDESVKPFDPDDTWTFYLLGLIRGHWERTVEADFQQTDLHGDERQTLNTGIAIVTPIEPVLRLLEGEQFVAQRAGVDELYETGRLVEDFKTGKLTAESPAFERFEELASKLLRVPKSELDDKLRESQE